MVVVSSPFAEIVTRVTGRNSFLPSNMSKQPSLAKGLSVAIALVLSHLSFADPLPGRIDLTSLPASVIDEVIVPNPDEVFSLMDKLGEPDWKSKVRRDFSFKTSGDRTNLALLFGTLIADGFIAVQAEDSQGVADAGREILALSKNLGLERAVVPHCNAILSACQARKWDQVKAEFDRTHKTVRDTLAQMKDEQLAQCVSVSGWIRGTEALTGLIGDGFSPERAEVLHQPDLAALFVSQLEAMDPKTAGTPTMQGMLTGLREVKSLMGSGEELSAQSVLRIHAICSDILTLIHPEGS